MGMAPGCVSWDTLPGRVESTMVANPTAGSCTCPLRINTAGTPVGHHRVKKFYTRGLSWHPSGPFTPGAALKAGRADTPIPHQLTATRRSLPCALFLTPALAAATAARERAGLLARSTRDRSAPPPSLASAAATSWLTLSRALAQAVARADARRCEVSKSYSTYGTKPAAGVRRPRPCRAWRPAVPPPPHAAGWSG